MAFTNEQTLAINSTGKNITVAASAGSGKTTVLVERMMKRVMEDKVPLDRFLAMTFTEAAANEMKSRLFDRLTKYMIEHPEFKEYCEKQLVLLSKAQISTIHSFCLNIIQENYAYIGFDLQRVNTIISEEEEETYFRKAFNDTIKKYEKLSSFSELKQNFTSKVYDTSTLYTELRSLSALLKEVNFDSFYETNKQIYNARTICDFPESTKTALFRFLFDYVLYLEDVIEKLLSIDEIQDKIIIKKNYLNEMKVACELQDYSMFLIQFHGFVQIPFTTVKDNPIYEPSRKELRKIEDYLLSILFDETVVIKDLNSQWPLIDLFLQMGKYYNEQMDYYKTEYCFMDFDDMELFAYQILSKHPEVADIYKHRFIDILVDEYQDSSKHQDAILSYITRGDNIFRVGDVKQSIYRFRNATPDLLKGYIENPTLQDQVIFLQHNFRSNSQIISYVNNTFQDFMNLNTFQSNFTQEDIALVGSEKQQTDATCIEYHVIKKNEFNEEDIEGYDSTQLRAEYIATQIKNIHDSNDCKWNDFVVLVRSNERKIDLKRAFTKLGIPNFIDSKEGFYKSSAVTYITSFMQCVLSPYVDNYFVALAMSPFYGLNDNQLAQITLDMREKQCKSYYEYAQAYGNDTLQAMIKDIHYLRYLGSLREKLVFMYSVNHFYDSYTTHSDRTNLDSLLEKACAYEETHSDSLEGFCSFIASLKEFKSSEALSINSKEDVVRVMTVHQSKGLQFPYVFYWGKEKANSLLEDNLLKHTEFGIYLNYFSIENRIIRTSLLREVISHITSKADLEEEIRVIYVALTRPSQKLILTTMLDTKQVDSLYYQGVSNYDLFHSENYAKWLLRKAMDMPNIVKIREINSLDITQTEPVKSINSFKLTPLSNYEHISLKKNPSSHETKLDNLCSNIGIKLGTMIHKILELINIAKEYSIEELQTLAQNEFTSDLTSRINYLPIMNFLMHPMTKELSSKNIYKEYSILYNDNGQIVSGIIDLVIEDNDTVYIVDYKTDNLSSNELVERYSEQLNLYQKILIKKYSTKEIKKYIYSLHLNEYILIK